MTVQFTITNADAMRGLAENIAHELIAGDVLVLDGPLGAGKTTFTQGLGAGLGVDGSVTSPTFVVSRIHKPQINLGLIHVDAYRLNSADELFDLELDERGNNVLVMEWGLPFVAAIAQSWLEITIARDEEVHADDPAGGERVVTLTGHGARWEGIDLTKVLA